MSEESRATKAKEVDIATELLSRSTIVLVSDYRGLTVAEMTALRRKLREQGIDYRVIKNTLASLAADKAGKEALKPLLVGPTAIAFGHGEGTPTAQVLLDYIRANKSALTIKGGVLGTRVITTAQVSQLATLPPRTVLVSKLMGNLQSPIYSLLNVLSADVRGLMTVLQARSKQQEVSANV